MVWDKSKPAQGSALVSAEIRANWDALDVALMAGSAGSLRLPIEQATLPDGTGTNNNPPELARWNTATAQTANTPKPTSTVAKFDAAVDEHLMWSFMLPANYGSGGAVRLKWFTMVTGGTTCVWKAGLTVVPNEAAGAGYTPFNAADLVSSPIPGTAAMVKDTVIPLTMTNAVRSLWVTIFIGRDADNAADTLASDAFLVNARFEYTVG